MVEPVARLLMGRGHPVTRARDVGLQDDDDLVMVDFALERGDLVIGTFDNDFRRSVVRRGCR
jgi:predicted nuclease of predicted toxin-antitoxin system